MGLYSDDKANIAGKRGLGATQNDGAAWAAGTAAVRGQWVRRRFSGASAGAARGTGASSRRRRLRARS